MKIRITAPGIYGIAGEIAIGTEFDVGEVPAGWAGRYEIVTGAPKPGAVPVTNPASTEIATAVAMLDPAEDALWTAAGLPAVDAVSELVGKPVTRKAIEDAAPDAKRPE